MSVKAAPIKMRKAFSLLDAIMGLCICACGFGLAFSTLLALAPKPQIQNLELYTKLFNTPSPSPSIHKAQREDTHAHTLGTLHYEGISYKASEGGKIGRAHV